MTIGVTQTAFAIGAVFALGYGPAWFFVLAGLSIAAYVLEGVLNRVWFGVTVFAVVAALVDVGNAAYYLPLADYGIPISIFLSTIAHTFAAIVAFVAAFLPPIRLAAPFRSLHGRVGR